MLNEIFNVKPLERVDDEQYEAYVEEFRTNWTPDRLHSCLIILYNITKGNDDLLAGALLGLASYVRHGHTDRLVENIPLAFRAKDEAKYLEKISKEIDRIQEIMQVSYLDAIVLWYEAKKEQEKS